MGQVKEINKKSSNMINTKNFDSNLLKIDKKSYKNIHIYSVNPLHLIIGKADGHIEE